MKKLAIYGLMLIIHSIGVQADTVNYLVMSKAGRPFQIEENGNHHEGIITDLVYEIFRNSKHTVVTHTFPYKRMQLYIQDQQFPNWLRYGSPDWGPLNSNLTDEPVFLAKNVIVSTKSRQFSYHTPSDLLNQRVILIFGFQYPGLEQLLLQKKIDDIRVKDFESAYIALDARRGEGVVDFETRAKYNLKSLGRNINDYDISYLGNVEKDFAVHLNMAPEISPELQAFINRRLNELKGEAFVEKLIKKYTE